MMIFDVSEIEAKWAGESVLRLIKGAEGGPVGLSAAFILSAKDYYSDVRDVTPPANGATVGQLAITRGKAAITVDLHKAFKIVRQLSGVPVATPFEWYLSQRNARGRFAGRVRVEITLPQFVAIQKALHARVGYLQSGWNSALKRVNAKITPQAARLNAPGNVTVASKNGKTVMRAENRAKTVDGVKDMQRRVDYVSNRHRMKNEKALKQRAEAYLQKIL